MKMNQKYDRKQRWLRLYCLIALSLAAGLPVGAAAQPGEAANARGEAASASAPRSASEILSSLEIVRGSPLDRAGFGSNFVAEFQTTEIEESAIRSILVESGIRAGTAKLTLRTSNLLDPIALKHPGVQGPTIAYEHNYPDGEGSPTVSWRISGTTEEVVLEFASLLVRSLQQIQLERIWTVSEILPTHRSECERVRQEVADLELSLESLTKACESAGVAELTADTLADSARMLADERRHIVIELAGLQARHDLIEKRLRPLIEKGLESANNDTLFNAEVDIAAAQARLSTVQLELIKIHGSQDVLTKIERIRAELPGKRIDLENKVDEELKTEAQLAKAKRSAVKVIDNRIVVRPVEPSARVKPRAKHGDEASSETEEEGDSGDQSNAGGE